MTSLSQAIRKNISFALIIFVLCSIALPFAPASAALPPIDLTGYAWSDNIGWISLNCTNNASCATASYKVTLDNTTNNLTGYAWSDNAGWIEFGGPNSTSGCPGGTCQARKSGSNILGWARVTSGDGVATTITTPGTTTYSTAGTQSFVVPSGVTSLTAALTGAGGSLATTSAIAVTAGETLTATVGAGGASTTLMRGAATLATGPGPGLSFTPKSDFVTGAGPYSVYLADVNRDGKQDLVVVNFNANSVSILLGNGAGGFGAKTDYTVGTGPVTAKLVDFNGDGYLDLVTANQNSNNISVLKGTVSGTFNPKVDYGTGAAPTSVVYGDVDNDGKLDIITANMTGNSISVLRGNGDATFNAKTDYATQINPFGARVGDLNNDGKVDIEVVNGGSTSTSIFLNNGSGLFLTRADYPVGGGPHSSVLADINTDGSLDIFASNRTSSTISVLLNNGSGVFGTKTDYATGLNPQSLLIGDVNGDGKLDMVNTNSGANTVSVFINNGDGTFGLSTSYNTGASPTGVGLGDVNGDGKPDILFANYNSGAGTTASILLNTTPASLGSATLTYTATNPVPLNGTDGWISFSSSNGGAGTYGVTVGTNAFSGYAWGSDVMGWIDFSAVSFPPPCAISNSCSIDHTQSVNTDAWCTVATTTCAAGYICKDTDGLCGYGNPSGTMTFSNQKVKKGKTVTISWNVLYASTCVVAGTNGDNWTPASSSIQTSQPIQNEATYTLSCQPVGGGTPVLLDTKKVTLIPSIREF